MKKELSKKEAREKIEEFFASKHSSNDVKKIKRLIMAYNIKLGWLRKLFCKKCYSMNLKVRKIKNMIKRVECGDCGEIMRWKIK